MRLIAMAIALLPLAVHAQVMKCPDGSYSDQCSGGETFQGSGVSSYSAPERHPIRPLPSTSRSSSERNTGGSASTRPSSGPSSVADRARGMGISRNDLVKARSRGIILIGMEEKDVIDILGKPSDVDTSTGYGSRCKTMYWHDRRGNLTDYVSTCGGRVDYYSKG